MPFMAHAAMVVSPQVWVCWTVLESDQPSSSPDARTGAEGARPSSTRMGHAQISNDASGIDVSKAHREVKHPRAKAVAGSTRMPVYVSGTGLARREARMIQG